MSVSSNFSCWPEMTQGCPPFNNNLKRGGGGCWNPHTKIPSVDNHPLHEINRKQWLTFKENQCYMFMLKLMFSFAFFSKNILMFKGRHFTFLDNRYSLVLKCFIQGRISGLLYLREREAFWNQNREENTK